MGEGEIAGELQAIQARLAALVSSSAETAEVGTELERIRAELRRLARDHQAVGEMLEAALGLPKGSLTAQAVAHLDAEDAPGGATPMTQQTADESPHDSAL